MEPHSGQGRPLWTASSPKTGPKWVYRGLVDLSTISSGSTGRPGSGVPLILWLIELERTTLAGRRASNWDARIRGHRQVRVRLAAWQRRRCSTADIAHSSRGRHSEDGTGLRREEGPICESGGEHSLPLLQSTRASAARFLLRSRDPVERLARDGVLSQKEAQLGRMFGAHGAW